jgi:PAS domain S-box-containing protein
VTTHRNPSNEGNSPSLPALQQEVTDRFGVLPNFFCLAPESPEITANLWGFAKFGYLDNPLPSLFKERLFVYLSRFCDIRYCIARHVGFLVGLGRPSGDRNCPTQPIDQVVRLIRRPLPHGEALEPHLSRLETCDVSFASLESGTEFEESVFACATHVFLQTPQMSRSLKALGVVLDSVTFQHLMVFLAFVRTAHYWTKLHTELGYEDDIKRLLAIHQELADCVLNDPQSASCDTAQLLLNELTALRRDSAAALRASENRVRAVFDQAAVGILVTDLSGRLLEVNPRLCQMLERNAEQLCAMSNEDLTHPDDRSRNQALMREVAEGRRAEFTIEKRYVRSDGSWIWVNVAVTPLRDASGRVQQLLGVIEDIHARKMAEEALRESERTQRLLAEIGVLGAQSALAGRMHVGELVKAIAERVAVEVNASRCGLSRVDLPGGQIIVEQDAHGELASLKGSFAIADFGYIVEDGLAGRPTVIDDLAADPRTADHFETTFRPIGVRAHINVPLHSEGRWVGTFWVTSHETRHWTDGEVKLLQTIAERVWLVVEQVRLATALQESEARARIAQQAAHWGVFEYDCLTGKNYWSPELEALYGLEPGTFEGTYEGWRRRLHPEDHDAADKAMEEAYETGEYSRDFRVVWDDGSVHWLFARAKIIRAANGRPLRVLGVNVDISDRKRTEEKLRDADRRKDEFLATLAHELRNPLAPIRNSLHILRLGGSDSGAAERVHDTLERQVNHMVRLVDDLMEVSRITRGKIDIRKELIEVAALVRSAVETSKPLIEEARHQLAISLPAEPLILHADPMRLAQVLANLLNNAAKYTPEGGQIWLTVRSEGSNVALSVRDSGAGIATEMLSKVFDLFTQADRTHDRAQGGLGIGLTLVRSLVDMHGGSVEARSDGPGHGSEFIVRLPLAVGRLAVQQRRLTDSPGESLAGRRVLVVDDSRDAADSLKMLLKLLGADVHSANDGLAALEALETYRPAIVLLDIGMPGMDGYEVARRMRQLSIGQEATLIALTGWGQEEDRRRSKEAGFDHHLVKPVDMGALQALLAALPGPAAIVESP